MLRFRLYLLSMVHMLDTVLNTHIILHAFICSINEMIIILIFTIGVLSVVLTRVHKTSIKDVLYMYNVYLAGECSRSYRVLQTFNLCRYLMLNFVEKLSDRFYVFNVVLTYQCPECFARNFVCIVVAQVLNTVPIDII